MESFLVAHVETFDDLTEILDDITDDTVEEYIVSESEAGYTVLQLPQVGAEISMTNGTDTLPCGSVASIQDDGKTIVALNGTRFAIEYPDGSTFQEWTYRDRWTLVPGRISKLSL